MNISPLLKLVQWSELAAVFYLFRYGSAGVDLVVTCFKMVFNFSLNGLLSVMRHNCGFYIKYGHE